MQQATGVRELAHPPCCAVTCRCDVPRLNGVPYYNARHLSRAFRVQKERGRGSEGEERKATAVVEGKASAT